MEHFIHTIYALYDTQYYEYFYVGRTERAVMVRFKEHQYAYKTGTEAKYQYMRNLEANGVGWRIEILAEVTSADENFEDFYVYKLLMAGQPLQNQKMGDSIEAARWDAMQRMRGSNQRYSDAKTFLSAREREVKEEKARRDAARLAAKVNKVAAESNPYETLFSFEKPQERFMSPAVRAMKARGHTHKGPVS